MIKLTDTQTMILTAGAQRTGNLALPLPKGLHGAAAKMAVTKMISHGWLQEVEASSSRGEPLWRETGDGHGTTLMVTNAGLLAIGVAPVVAQTMTAVWEHAAEASVPKPPTQRAGTKQAVSIWMTERLSIQRQQEFRRFLRARTSPRAAANPVGSIPNPM